MALLTAIVFLALLSLISARLRAPPVLGKYYVNLDGGIQACEGGTTQIFDVEKLVMEKKNKTVLEFVGDVGLSQDTSDVIKFVMTVYKNINGNYEYLSTITEENLCKHIMEKNKPWSSLVTEMGINGCPIPKKVYTFKGFSFDLSGVPLSAINAGSYRNKIELFERGERTVCLMMNASIQQ